MIFHHNPRFFLVPGCREQRQARSAGSRNAWPVRSRHRSSHPLFLRRRVEPILEFADVPGAGDVHRDVAALEFLEEVGHLRARDRGRQTLTIEAQVEIERESEWWLLERAIAAAVTQNRRLFVEREDHRLRTLVGGHESGEKV